MLSHSAEKGYVDILCVINIMFVKHIIWHELRGFYEDRGKMHIVGQNFIRNVKGEPHRRHPHGRTVVPCGSGAL